MSKIGAKTLPRITNECGKTCDFKKLRNLQKKTGVILELLPKEQNGSLLVEFLEWGSGSKTFFAKILKQFGNTDILDGRMFFDPREFGTIRIIAGEYTITGDIIKKLCGEVERLDKKIQNARRLAEAALATGCCRVTDVPK